MTGKDDLAEDPGKEKTIEILQVEEINVERII